jgi:membrane protein YdbS with pleckstrin-like domain
MLDAVVISPTSADAPAAAPWQPLDPRTIKLQRLEGTIFVSIVSACLFLGALAIVLTTTLSFWVDAGLVSVSLFAKLVLGWHFYRWPRLAFARAGYRLDDDGIEIRRGVIWRSIIDVPRSRVQHTDVSQGPLERRFGLGTVVIYTAGSEHAQVQLSGVAHETAIAIRDQLLPHRRADVV